MIVNVQKHNYATEEIRNQSVEEVMELFNDFDWMGEWRAYKKNVTQQKELPINENEQTDDFTPIDQTCPPGIIIAHHDSDKTVHVFMEYENQFDLYYHYTEKVKLLLGFYQTKKHIQHFKANVNKQQLLKIVTLFDAKDFDALKPITNDGK